MLAWFRNLSIKSKLIWISMLTSYAVLVLASTAFVAYELLTYRAGMLNTLATRAQIIAQGSTAALSFNDPKPIEESLAALSADTHLLAATVFDQSNRIVARYVRADKITVHQPPRSEEAGHRFDPEQLTVHQPVQFNGRKLGSVCLERDLLELDSRMKRYAAIVVTVLLASLLLAFVMASNLQRVISGPILHLARIAATVASRKDYSVRAEKRSQDELGELIDRFNEMLAQIQFRDWELQKARTGLEQRVTERTAELSEANVLLKQEIAERQRAEGERKKLAALVEHSRDFISLATMDEQIIYLNSAGCRLVGFDGPEEALGRDVEDFYTDESRSQYREIIRPALKAHGFWQGESLLRNFKSNQAIPVHRGLFYIQDPKTLEPICQAVVIRDITEQHRAEEALRESEERFARAFRANPVPAMLCTLAGRRMIDVNDSFLRQMQFRREEVLGRTMNDLGLWPEPGELTRLVEKAEHQHSVKDIEYQLRTQSGDMRAMIVSVEKIDVRGEPCLLFNAYDITERRNLEAQLRQSQKMEAVGQLAAGVAHDFNNILTVIQGHTSLLLSEASHRHGEEASLQEIATSASRAANLVRQLLAFSRKQAMQPRPLDLNTVVSNAVKMLERLLGANISIQLNFSPHLPPALADTGMVEQVIVNLVMNARDAMPDGGQLAISTSVETVDEQRAAQNPESRPGQFVCLSVRDTGTGMDTATAGRIFEPFFTTKDVGKGTGLGLATVYGIVKQHQGWIEVASELGRGTTFRIYFPVTEKPPEADESKAAKNTVKRGTETILLVEDETALRNLVAGFLKSYGYYVLTAPNGREALKLWREQSPAVDLLITDMMMPEGVSGAELARQLRAESPNLKVLYMSGYSAELFSRNVELQEGINFLAKPYQPQHLAETIRACLDHRD